MHRYEDLVQAFHEVGGAREQIAALGVEAKTLDRLWSELALELGPNGASAVVIGIGVGLKVAND